MFAAEFERLRSARRRTTRWKRRPVRSTSTARTSSRRTTASQGTDRRAAERALPDGSARRSCFSRATAHRSSTSSSFASAADDRTSCVRKGRRGHRVLPLPPAHRVERGRRRPADRFSLGRVDSIALRSIASTLLPALRCSRRRRHDTKRAGDVRARIGARSPASSERWADACAQPGASLAGRPRRSNEDYLVLADARRCLADRSRRRLERLPREALREAKRNTNWAEPNEQHEARVMAFVRHRSTRTRHSSTTSSRSRPGCVALAGEHASLGALLLRLTMPGLPGRLSGRRVLVARRSRRRPGQPAPDRRWARLLSGSRGAETPSAAGDGEVPSPPAGARRRGCAPRTRTHSPAPAEPLASSVPAVSASSAAGGFASIVPRCVRMTPSRAARAISCPSFPRRLQALVRWNPHTVAMSSDAWPSSDAPPAPPPRDREDLPVADQGWATRRRCGSRSTRAPPPRRPASTPRCARSRRSRCSGGPRTR